MWPIFSCIDLFLKKKWGIWIFGPCLEKKDINLFEPAHQILHLVWPRSAPACFKLIIILSVLKLNFRLIFCPILALNFNFRPNTLKLLLFHLNKSTHFCEQFWLFYVPSQLVVGYFWKYFLNFNFSLNLSLSISENFWIVHSSIKTEPGCDVLT